MSHCPEQSASALGDGNPTAATSTASTIFFTMAPTLQILAPLGNHTATTPPPTPCRIPQRHRCDLDNDRINGTPRRHRRAPSPDHGLELASQRRALAHRPASTLHPGSPPPR